MFFVQGSSYKLPIRIQDNNCKDINISLIESAKFSFGDIVKTYGEDVIFDYEKQAFIVPLSAKETSTFDRLVKFQASITFLGGETDNTRQQTISVYSSNKSILGE